MFVTKTLLKAALLPPGIFIILALFGLIVMPRRKRLGITLIAFAITLMAVLSLSIVSGLLYRTINLYGPVDLSGGLGNIQAIVVLTGGMTANSPEYQRDIADEASLSRGRYAVFLHKKTGLPIMVVGGKPNPSTLSEGEAMEHMINEEFQVHVRWVESQSKDTEESAINSFEMLNRDGIVNILLITHGFHMRRAELAFTNVGFKVTPAPIKTGMGVNLSMHSFLPSTGALSTSAFVLKEWFGIAWGYIKGMFRS